MPPAGFKRSRVLWDEVRRPHDSKMEDLRAWIAAVTYELQPVRFAKVLTNDNRQRVWGTLKHLICLVVSLGRACPGLLLSLFRFVRNRSLRQWAWVTLAVVYYAFVRWIHELLDAGPIVVILTLLALIFTIGLSDGGNEDGISAYSVFNRGFERLLGSVDVDSLLAQHVGGGLGGMAAGGGAAAMPAAGRNNNDDDDHPPPARRRRADNNNNDNNHRNLDNGQNNNGGIEDRGYDNDGGDDDPQRNQRNNNNNRARKSGKKARRRNLEQRREIQRQREAAMQMGLDGGQLGENQEEMVAMQQLLEQQIEAENRRE